MAALATCRVVALLLVVKAAVQDDGPLVKGEVDLAQGDECLSDRNEDCALHALQRRSEKRVAKSLKSDVEAEVAANDVAQAKAAAVAKATAEAQAWAEAEAEAERLTQAEERVEAAAEKARAQLSPRHRYNSSAFGGRLAPAMATQYDGLEDRREFHVQSDGFGVSHIFAVGDWGAILPNHYTAPNKRGFGMPCPQNCGYVNGIDDRAQILVANVMKQRAGISNPQYVLNVGDNFYWSGIEEGCASNEATSRTYSSFAAGWQGIYAGLASKPWISALGNHDYGGWQFNRGWPQQIGYSFVNRNWVLPARYYSKVMNHGDFTVEYFIIDSNAFDAKDPDEDPEHNICSREHNPSNANCAMAGGPTSPANCKEWFWSTYNQQKGWLQAKLAESRANWQIVITHFPCGTDAGFYRHLYQSAGLDLLVTGHRHDQELWPNSGLLGGLTCFVTGGGGGITSEAPPVGMGSSQYGFFDLTISKTKMKVELIALNGVTIQESFVYPH